MLNEIEKLDLVLRHMASQYPQTFAEKKGVLANQILEIYPELKVNEVDFSAEMYFILEKLVDDGYVIKHEMRPSGWPEYAITFDGAYFIKYMDGYQGLQSQKTAQIRQEQEREKRVLSLESFQQEQAKRLNKLTLLAVLGTAALVLWEILKYFVFDHHWYFHPY